MKGSPMGRMLQALRQIESRSSGIRPTSPTDAVEPAPSVDNLMDSAQQMWQQVEAALEAERATSPGTVPPCATDVSPVPCATDVPPVCPVRCRLTSVRRPFVFPVCHGRPAVLPAIPPAETATAMATATTSTADPYGLLAATVLGSCPRPMRRH